QRSAALARTASYRSLCRFLRPLSVCLLARTADRLSSPFRSRTHHVQITHEVTRFTRPAR
ncbi:MAG: hypothetical protein V4793_47925, partial [Paraburkholderia tropica]